MSLTRQQVENIQIDHGIVFVNYGVAGEQRQLGPTRGGGEFTVTKNIRDIEYDGRHGKMKGLQVVDEIDARLTLSHLDASLDTLRLAMPYASYEETGTGGKLVCDGAAVGLISEGAYLNNVTMFAKVVGGGYKKITLYNAMSEADFTLTAAPKGEGEMPLEVFAHWDPLDDTSILYEIEDVTAMDPGDVEPPEIVDSYPESEATEIPVESDLTVEFDKDVRPQDINAANFTLLELPAAEVVAGTMAYAPVTKTATFTPSAVLEASTDYTWLIANVRDRAGNVMDKTVINFKTV